MPRPKGSKNKVKATVQTQAAIRPAPDVSEEKRRKWARLLDEETVIDDSSDRLKVPPELIPDGMDYMWVTDSIYGQPQTRRASFERKGWEPVPAQRHDGIWTPQGHKGTIEIEGLILMERPKELSIRARNAELRAARLQVSAKEAQLRGGDIEGVAFDTKHPNARNATKVNKSYERVPVPND